MQPAAGGEVVRAASFGASSKSVAEALKAGAGLGGHTGGLTHLPFLWLRFSPV